MAEELEFKDGGAPGSGVIDKKAALRGGYLGEVHHARDPAGGWDEDTQLRREVHFTKGQIHVRGKMVARGKSKFADYVLYYKPNIPIAIVEAKDNNHAVGDGMQQALEYAEILNIPFVFSRTATASSSTTAPAPCPRSESSLPLDAFPSPARLWSIYREWKGLTAEAGASSSRTTSTTAVAGSPATTSGTRSTPRPRRSPRAQTACCSSWRPAPARPTPRSRSSGGSGRPAKKRVLYLADRNVLIDQTMVNDFRPFKGAMAKLRTRRRPSRPLRAHRRTIDPPSTESGASTRPTRSTSASTRRSPARRSGRSCSASSRPDFFDLIVVDECHRGSAADDAAWREILEYFSSATQIGLTATPKETKYVSNIHYFGEPVYTYSLKQGIQDGFLAPYKVINVHIDVDVEGYRPPRGQLDSEGEEIPDRIYNQKDFDRTLVIDDRTKLVAKRVTEFLKESGEPLPEDDRLLRRPGARGADAAGARQREPGPRRREPPLRDADHRQRPRGPGPARQLHRPRGEVPGPRDDVATAVDRRRRPDLPAHRPRPASRIDDRVQADPRPRNASPRGHPQVLLHADGLPGCDAATSPTRTSTASRSRSTSPTTTTRSCRRTTRTSNSTRTRSSSTPATTSRSSRDEPESRKFYVNGVLVTIIAERVKYLDADGKLITESLRDYSKRAVTNQFASLDTFLRRWNAADRKQADHRRAGGGRAAARAAGRRGQPRPRSVRPHLPRRLRTVRR